MNPLTQPRLPLLALSLPLTIAACGSPTSVICLGIISPAVVIEVLDSVTLRPAAGGAEGWVRDGSYEDSLVVIGWTGPEINPSTAIQMAGAYERSGTYTVEISRPGYAQWRREGVRAREGSCGVETVELTAKLQPVHTLLD